MSTAGRTDYASYHDTWQEQSLADEQRLEAKTCELANWAFSAQTAEVRDWLQDAASGECSMAASVAVDAILFAAIYASPADLALTVDRLRACFVDECADDFLDTAAEDLADEDADCAADFEDARVST